MKLRPEYIYYKIMRGISRVAFPRAETVYEVQPGDEPAVFVCNHAAIRGPVMITLHFKRRHRAWAVSNTYDRKRAYSYAYHDVLMGECYRRKGIRRLLARVIAVMLPALVRCSDTIPVYHDRDIMKTFKQSVRTLEDGCDLVIFAESPARWSEYVCELQEGFVDLGRFWYRRSGKRLRFFPVYVEKKNAVISVGTPISYDPQEPIESQRERIAVYLRDNIDRLARQLPPHKPVPFLSPRWYSAYGCFEHDVQGYWQMIDQDHPHR